MNCEVPTIMQCIFFVVDWNSLYAGQARMVDVDGQWQCEHVALFCFEQGLSSLEEVGEGGENA